MVFENWFSQIDTGMQDKIAEFQHKKDQMGLRMNNQEQNMVPKQPLSGLQLVIDNQLQQMVYHINMT